MAERGSGAHEDRRLTLIIVPHGDLETRTYQVRYGRLKLALAGAGLVLVAFVVMISTWFYMLAQVARLPGLEGEVRRLESERAQVAELARTLSVVEEQYERVRQMLGADAGPRGRDDWLPPLRPGMRDDGIAARDASLPTAWPLTHSGWVTREGGEAHPGIDVAVPNDSYIRAAADGVVLAAGRDEVYGVYVLVGHADGFETMYGHASRLFVAVGDTLERHEVIALSGSTGRSTAPHLHFEIRRNGEPVDPFSLLRTETHGLAR